MVHMIIEMVSIVVLPLPPEMAKGAGYDAPRTASHRDLSWRPFCSTSTSLTCGASNRDTYLCPPYNNSSVFPTTTTTYMQCSGRIINGMQSGRTTPQDSALQFQTPVHTHPEWPSQEEPWSRSTASAPVSDVSSPACTNGVWPPLRPASVAQNKPSGHVVLHCPIHRFPTDYTAWGSGR